MIEANVKVQMIITLDSSGRVGCQASTQNLCTIFGMLELVKKAYLENSLRPPKIVEEVHGVLQK